MQTPSQISDIPVSAIKADTAAEPRRVFDNSLSTMTLPHALLAYVSFLIFLFLLPVFLLMFIGDLPGKYLWKKQSADRQSFTAEHTPEPMREMTSDTSFS